MDGCQMHIHKKTKTLFFFFLYCNWKTNTFYFSSYAIKWIEKISNKQNKFVVFFSQVNKTKFYQLEMRSKYFSYLNITIIIVV